VGAVKKERRMAESFSLQKSQKATQVGGKPGNGFRQINSAGEKARFTETGTPSVVEEKPFASGKEMGGGSIIGGKKEK